MTYDLRLLVRTAMSRSTSAEVAAELVGCSPVTIRRYRRIAREKNLTWEGLQQLDLSDLDGLFNSSKRRFIAKRMPDFSALIEEEKKPVVTKGLLWEEYRESDPDTAYSYSQFTHHWREYEDRNNLSMRMWHPPGRAIFVDYSGKRARYYCQRRNDYVDVEVFVGVLGHSQKMFAYATESQTSEDFLLSHAEMFAYFGGASEFVVSDCLKAAVIHAPTRRYNPQYIAFADQYDVIIDPARPLRPQDKSLVENAVKITQRWILARIRNVQFFSLEEVNRAIRTNLDVVNNKPRRKTRESRNTCFERTEQQLLRPLPELPYEPGTWTGKIRVDKTYHVAVDGSWYSVPHTLVTRTVTARYGANIVEIFLERKRIASHARARHPGETVTEPSHCPPNHRVYHQETEESLYAWVINIGASATAVIAAQFKRSQPQLGIPNCVRLKALCEAYGTEAFEAACKRAVELHSPTLTSVKAFLQSGRYRDAEDPVVADIPPHSNIRGSDYYKEKIA